MSQGHESQGNVRSSAEQRESGSPCDRIVSTKFFLIATLKAKEESHETRMVWRVAEIQSF
jgi:hypothetical protein